MRVEKQLASVMFMPIECALKLGVRACWIRRDGATIVLERQLAQSWDDAAHLLAFAERAKPGDELEFEIEDSDGTTTLSIVSTREALLEVASAHEIVVARTIARGLAAPEQRVDIDETNHAQRMGSVDAA